MEPESEKEREPAERRWYSAERAREDMAEIEAEWRRRLDRTMVWAVVFGAASAAGVTLALHLLLGIWASAESAGRTTGGGGEGTDISQVFDRERLK